jgi:hypothetical protein
MHGHGLPDEISELAGVDEMMARARTGVVPRDRIGDGLVHLLRAWPDLPHASRHSA